MKLADLISDPATGQLSHSKLWTNVVNVVITIIVVGLYRDGLFHDGRVGIDWLLAYAAIVGSIGVASKLVSLRWGDRSAIDKPTNGGST